MQEMKRKEKLDSSMYCPTSCDSLYGGRCIMRINGVYNGGLRLLYYELGFGRHYIRREDCPMRKEKDETNIPD